MYSSFLFHEYNDSMESNRNLSQFKNTLFDILVIGGGINGAGIARDAALRGFKVALIEKNDFASGTSSKTSKLVHGGLRYLEQGHFKLVYEALHERHHLLTIAPHLVHPLPFLLPIYENTSPSSWKIKLGLSLYDKLAGGDNIHPYKTLDIHQIQKISKFKKEGLKNIFHFYDAQMNDARLCLENILSAIDSSAICLNYCQAIDFIREGEKIIGVQAQDILSNHKIEIRAKVVVNATGPWVDQLLRLQKKELRPRLRTTKGVHIVLPRLSDHHALLLTTASDGRVFFCLPWGAHSLVGTTDTDFSKSADEVSIEPKDIHYLLNEIQRVFPQRKISATDIISSFAGLRPLVSEEGSKASQVSREYKIEETFPGLISILGGKFTTYRSLAEKVVDQISKKLSLHQARSCQTASTLLPGAKINFGLGAFKKEWGLSHETASHLIKNYGAKSIEIMKLAKEFSLEGRVCTNHPHIKAEILYAFTREYAQTLEDFFTRRTFIRHDPCRGLQCLNTVSNVLEELALFTSGELEEQKRNYKNGIEKESKIFLI